MLGPIGAAPFLVPYVILVSAYALTWVLLCGLIALYGRTLDLFGTPLRYLQWAVRAPFVHLRGAFVRLFSVTMALFGYVGTRVTSCELGDAAYMLADDTESSDWDARKYPKSRPFAGAKGVLFENFVRDFGAALSSEIDEDADLEETMLGTDLGGDAYAGQANVTAASTRVVEGGV